MQEIELKFLVPQARLKGLMRQAKVKSSQTTMMSAHYFDTPKQELAKSGIGLRIRLEGDEWVLRGAYFGEDGEQRVQWQVENGGRLILGDEQVLQQVWIRV